MLELFSGKEAQHFKYFRDGVSQGKEALIASMGGKFSVNVDRENMTYNATVLKDDVPKAMEVLAAAVKVGYGGLPCRRS